MRILYLCPHAWSGEYTILQELRRSGHDVCVLEENRSGDGRSWYRTPDFRQPGDGMATLWYDPRRGLEKLLTWPVDRWFKRAFNGRNLGHHMLAVWRAIQQFVPDVVVSPEGFSYGIPAALLKRLGLLRQGLMVSYIGGDILDCEEAEVGKRRTPRTSWLIRSSMKGPDVFRPLCRSLADILLHEGAPRERVHILPIQLAASRQSLDRVFAGRAEIRRKVRAALAIPDDAPVIVTLGGNQKGKGVHLLAQVWPRIRARVSGCHWLLCGPETPWLAESVFPLLGDGSQIHVTGRLTGDAVLEHLAAADLHLNPTLCEGLNVASLEAAAVGTPTITSDGAGVADWIRRHEAGQVVPAGDADALAEAVIQALRNQDQCLTWGERSRTMAGEFTPDQVVLGLQALLAKAAGR